ncbi:MULTISPECIES: hypothetical protein [Vibrio]|jgi:hypothetical protein|uniref:Inverse autotransporter beta-domain domain-containing protein n=1 Tax=Vibrio harveyi TaxID=669 RepID=A0A454DAK1_VIBHA|nr:MULTISPECIES: hypothetical protein [Vibrio]AIV08544.1 hypothetical protein LA59_24440 [Vibrio harveyi]AMG00475.1 hypothetical protein AL538_22610 [Vibrio harveyi]AWB02119.1 hypothetical protein CU052_23230 [Vibrio harveyi]EKM22348.1 hypothetical protein VCHENC01_3831 [Vibrio harveyi]EKM31031.1 hypothetical protein VCHENC02_3289 [Vibrio harveyi]
MPWIYVRKLFLLLLAMALSPMQASAAQAEQKSYLPHFSKLQPFTASNSASNSPVDFSELSEESTQSPVSEGHAFQDSFAIFNSQRWTTHLRENIDDEHIDFIGDLNAPFYADAGYAYSLMDISWRQSQSTFNHFVSDHRLSGWKETNAMYVALNSQFSA